MFMNVGTIDRTIRALLGVALLALVFVGPKTNWGLIGLIPLVTGLAGYCPLIPRGRRQHMPGTHAPIMEPTMLTLFLFPGNVVCDLAGIPADSDHRQILRSFVNVLVWSAVAIGIALWISL